LPGRRPEAITQAWFGEGRRGAGDFTAKDYAKKNFKDGLVISEEKKADKAEPEKTKL
jgi:hypothetical protein